MLPGYGGLRNNPYFSPIHVLDVHPRKTGRSELGLEFVNALYAAGAKTFALDLRVLKHEANYLIAALTYGQDGPKDRTVIISHIEMGWIRRFCPELWAASPPAVGSPEAGSPKLYLDSVFGLDQSG